MNPSKADARKHLETHVLPRRVRDVEAERFQFATQDKAVEVYRRVAPDEEDRGELFPVNTAGISTFAHFGVGVGIYFLQLLILCIIFFCAGMIMIGALGSYNQSGYGMQSQTLYAISAACAYTMNVTATIGCDSNEMTCRAELKPRCELPYNAALADLVMSVFFVAAIYLSRFGEKYMEEELDESVQTAQDYSVEVCDPDDDADNPDEWYNYFSRFGTVRYITITRKNNSLAKLVLEKHQLHHKYFQLEAAANTESKLSESVFQSMFQLPSFLSVATTDNGGANAAAKLKKIEIKKDLIMSRLIVVDKTLELAYLKSYPVCRVYVTFEYEEHQRLCLKDLEVPDIQAIFDIKSATVIASQRKLFRGTNVLNVREPPEPDNILWENIEISPKSRSFYRVFSFLAAIALLAACYYLIIAVTSVDTALLSIAIGLVDAILPSVFVFLTDLSSPTAEGKDRQRQLQVKLFYTRLMLSTAFPYVQAKWDEVLTPAFIEQIMSVQITACFTSILLDIVDITGIIQRHIVNPLFAETQEELNQSSGYSGKQWSLAEKYTGIAKILFISLFYSLLTPLSLFIATLAFLAMFFVDRYQLLRRWKPTPMLDAKIASRLRQQALLGVVAHMYVTSRFIYSWPMDNAYLVDASTNTYAVVNKRPSYNPWSLGARDWHSDSQKRILLPYKVCFTIVVVIAIYIWIVGPGVRMVRKLFCFQYKEVGQSQGKPFSSVSNIKVYVPIVRHKDEQYTLCHTKEVLPQHKPSLVKNSPSDNNDITVYVPEKHQPHVLAVVKYYGELTNDPEAAVNSSQIITTATANETSGSGTPGDVQSQQSRNAQSQQQRQQSSKEQFRLVTNANGVIEKLPVGLPPMLLEKLKSTTVVPPPRRSHDLNSSKPKWRNNRSYDDGNDEDGEDEDDSPFNMSPPSRPLPARSSRDNEIGNHRDRNHNRSISDKFGDVRHKRGNNRERVYPQKQQDDDGREVINHSRPPRDNMRQSADLNRAGRDSRDGRLSSSRQFSNPTPITDDDNDDLKIVAPSFNRAKANRRYENLNSTGGSSGGGDYGGDSPTTADWTRGRDGAKDSREGGNRVRLEPLNSRNMRDNRRSTESSRF